MSQAQTQKTTKSGSSNNSKKASKKSSAKQLLSGDDYVEEKKEDVAINAGVTEEDLALDQELEKMAKEQENMEPVINTKIDKKVDKAQTKSYFVLQDIDPEIGAASTVNELKEQVQIAKLKGIEGIEATDKIVRLYNREKFPECGYFVFENIRVYRKGIAAEVKRDENRNVEESIFAHSGVEISAIRGGGEVGIPSN